MSTNIVRGICLSCGAEAVHPDSNLHCAWDGKAHPWHVCGDAQGDAAGSDCPAKVAA